uniref:Ubinuclein middle domain-containing protein n=1 Tax=Graphocephala atropunctata TaxID=36148 RepID=A0A1B6LLU5_9HEMI
MSEQTRATLTPFGKSDKTTKKSPRQTLRLSFILSDPNEDSCSVFDYGSVVKSEEGKLIKKKEDLYEEKKRKPNGVVDPVDDEEEKEIKRLAAAFEEKYGNKTSKTKKGRPKSKSYAELGAGYDETDPFIDNTEAYDEALEENQETPCGGYYINSGPLELKRVQSSDQSDAEEFGRRKHKRGLPLVVEEEEEEDEEEENEDESAEVEESIDETEKTLPDEGPTEPKKARLAEELEQIEEKHSPVLNDSEEQVKNKKKRLITDDGDSKGVQNKMKKAKTVKTLLEEKRVREVPPLVTDEGKKHIASSTSICEAIESVVNAGNHEENSNSSHSTHSGSGSTSTTENSQEGKQGSQNVPPPLPENLTSELMSLLEQIRHIAAVTDNTRNTFCSDINNALVKLEWKTTEFSATNRNLLFAHLASFLPCTKDTLMRRAKKLFIHEEESRIDTVICKLKATIDVTMPSLLEKYEKECQRIAEEKGITSAQNNGSQLTENQQTSDSASPRLPKRKFPWTEETRGYLKEIVRLKNRCFKVLKPRKSTYEDYVNTFLHTKVRMLWPQGWMRTSTLQREMHRSPSSGKSKHSSNHSPSKSDSTRLNVSLSYPSPSNGMPHPLYVTTSASSDISHQPLRSPHTPQVARSTNPLNLLTKITSSLDTSSGHQKNPNPYSPALQQSVKTEKPESFSMDCLLKRPSENSSCNDYNTTLSDLLKQDSVIMNGASLPLANVNSSQMNNCSRSEKILDLSSCNSTVSGSPSVIHSVSTNERTTLRASDSVSLSANIPESSKHHTNAPMPFRKENNAAVERRLSDETTTATDILSQIISESLLAPPMSTPTPAPVPASAPAPAPAHYNMVVEDIKETPQSKNQALLFDVMKDLKELNDLSSGGSLDTKHDSKKNNYSSTSWSKPPKTPDSVSKTSQYQNEFLKHLRNSQSNPLPPAATPPYSRHSESPYENPSYMNDINKSVYNSSSHLSAQSMASLAGSQGNKISQINQGCIMKALPNTGISSGNESQQQQ